MVLCALSIFGIVVLIAVELVLRSQAGLASVRLSIFLQCLYRSGYQTAAVLGPGKRAFQRLAVHLRHAGLIVSGAAAGGSAGHRRGRLSYRDVPQAVRGPLAFMTELLAAIPSVIYGLWAVFVLVPLLQGACESVTDQAVGLDRAFRRR